MTDNELKWYIVSKIGSKVSENKILKNEQLYKTLQSVIGTNNIDTILEHLHNMGFTLIPKQENKTKVEPTVKTYYVEPKSFEKPKTSDEHNGYVFDCISNNKSRMKTYYQEKRKEKIENGLSKPYYRENTNYNSIW